MMGEREPMFDIRPAVAAFNKKVKASEVVLFTIASYIGIWFFTREKY